METTLLVIAFVVLLACSAVGVALALLTLPGTWLILVAGVVLGYGTPALAGLMGREMAPLFDPRWLAFGGGLALLAEIVEFFASAAGAKKAGGGRSGMIFSLIGGLAGGIVGGILIPVVGAIPGGVVGAAAGAMLGERGVSGKSWRDAARVGQGAAAGKLAAMVAKSAAAAIIALVLLVGVWR